MANNIRGWGLFGPAPVPGALFESPERLDREGGQSSEPPPPYRSRSSHNPDLFRGSNLFPSPEPPSEEQRLRDERRFLEGQRLRDEQRLLEEQRLRENRKWELMEEHRASFPCNQFLDEWIEEMDRIEEASQNQTDSDPIERRFLVWENVKTRWVEQGIWNEKWTDVSEMVRWKHEEPLELESESEDDLAAEGEPRRLVREREREASRPFHQFVYQVSKERERIQDEMKSPNPMPYFSNPPGLVNSDFDFYLYVWTPKRQPHLYKGEAQLDE
ncbi:unnamed protein product [Clonostachys rosea f. rosea IK726]|uniref:Uncharacterized protein n=1 Tax=Clonostachys rosea f. rosea IK726 TaxID=1349383 RepID=A0ACA9TXL0_BIOOC|nr:unnamed protein product [Clonostachys rosea f. rosea IK726]